MRAATRSHSADVNAAGAIDRHRASERAAARARRVLHDLKTRERRIVSQRIKRPLKHVAQLRHALASP